MSQKTYNIVVFDGNPLHKWVDLFSGCTLSNGSTINVVQCSWLETSLTTYPGKEGCMITIAPVSSTEGVVRPQVVTLSPDFLIVRNQPRGPTPDSDMRHVLFGLMTARIPSINSLHSIYMNLERPIMFAALREIESRVGHENFPLIAQTYYSDNNQMIIAPPFPCVLKVSFAHAGMGKILIKDGNEFRDTASIIALNKLYCTAEPFIDAEYGIRIQKVAGTYRVMKKVFTGSSWKSQFGGASLLLEALTDTYKFWIDECEKLFGGMDIIALDALHGKDGKDYIIELNDTAIGMLTETWEEDSVTIRNLALDKMDTIYIKNDTLHENNLIIGGENFIKDDTKDRFFKGKRTDPRENEKRERKQRRIIEEINDDLGESEIEQNNFFNRSLVWGFVAGISIASLAYFFKNK